MKNKNIAVLVGGPSVEADVSRRTGGAVCKALQEAGYKANLLEFNRETISQDLLSMKVDIVFNAIHGKYGEDGSLQGLLEIHNIPYTGSGVMSSAIGMNKKITKDLFIGAGISTARSCAYDAKQISKDNIKRSIKENFTVPFVIKAATQGGSSIGVAIVKEYDQFDKAFDDIIALDHSLIVEEFLDGKEFTVAILDGKALPVIMINPHSGNYDYTSKYTVGATDYLVPAPIDESLTARLQELGESAYKVLHCEGVARVDIMTNSKGDAFVLEVNTIPGMTETSLVPKAAAAIGMDFTTLCERILATASVEKW